MKKLCTPIAQNNKHAKIILDIIDQLSIEQLETDLIENFAYYSSKRSSNNVNNYKEQSFEFNCQSKKQKSAFFSGNGSNYLKWVITIGIALLMTKCASGDPDEGKTDLQRKAGIMCEAVGGCSD